MICYRGRDGGLICCIGAESPVPCIEVSIHYMQPRIVDCRSEPSVQTYLQTCYSKTEGACLWGSALLDVAPWFLPVLIVTLREAGDDEGKVCHCRTGNMHIVQASMAGRERSECHRDFATSAFVPCENPLTTIPRNNRVKRADQRKQAFSARWQGHLT